MSFADKQLLVTGASGNLGKAVVAELRRLGAKKVIAATRTPGKNAELRALGVEEREADFDRPETLEAAFRGVERLLLVSTDSLHAPDVRVKQHRAAVRAAKNAGVEHIVYTSIPHARPTVGHSIPDDHFWTEAAIYESGSTGPYFGTTCTRKSSSGLRSSLSRPGNWFPQRTRRDARM
jgi:NAD(P)H dehydrogenase (quinone)